MNNYYSGVPTDPYADYDPSLPGDERVRRQQALQNMPGPEAPPPVPSNVPEPPPVAAVPPPDPAAAGMATQSTGPAADPASQTMAETKAQTPTSVMAQQTPAEGTPAPPPPPGMATEEGPDFQASARPPDVPEKPLASSTSYDMGKPKVTTSATDAAIKYGNEILRDPKTGDFKKPSMLQNIGGAVLSMYPNLRHIDVHPGLTRQYQNYGMLANMADEERKAQVAQAQEQSHRASATASLARANRDTYKGDKVQQYKDMQRAREEEADRMDFKRGSVEWNKYVANIPPTTNTDSARGIAEAIASGRQPPTIKGMYRQGPEVRSILEKEFHFDLAKAEMEWQATSRHMSTLNGPDQERLRQSIKFTTDSLDVIDQLYQKWKEVSVLNGVGSKLLNRAELAASAHLPGERGQVAQALMTQIGDFTASLGSVYMGGHLPTEDSLKLAAQNLKGEWNDETFSAAVQLAKNNLRLRQNAILTSDVAGVQNSRYAPEGTAPAPQPQIDILKPKVAPPAAPAPPKPPAEALTPGLAPDAATAQIAPGVPAPAPPTPTPASPIPNPAGGVIAKVWRKGKEVPYRFKDQQAADAGVAYGRAHPNE